MTARDKLIHIIQDWHSEYCASLATGCDHFAHPSERCSTEADRILAEHAHELAEKQRKLGDAVYEEGLDDSYSVSVGWSNAADAIDPEVNK